jgi:hypothetical protein
MLDHDNSRRLQDVGPYPVLAMKLTQKKLMQKKIRRNCICTEQGEAETFSRRLQNVGPYPGNEAYKEEAVCPTKEEAVCPTER